MREVFGIKLVAACCTGGGKNCAVPVRKTVSGFDLQRTVQDCTIDILHLKAQPGSNQLRRYCVRQRRRARGAHCLYIKFLQHLDRQNAILPFKQGDGFGSFGDFIARGADGINQNIGVEESSR